MAFHQLVSSFRNEICLQEFPQLPERALFCAGVDHGGSIAARRLAVWDVSDISEQGGD